MKRHSHCHRHPREAGTRHNKVRWESSRARSRRGRSRVATAQGDKVGVAEGRWQKRCERSSDRAGRLREKIPPALPGCGVGEGESRREGT